MNPVDRLDHSKISSYFGCNTFNLRTMQDRLPKDVYRALKKTIKRGERLSPEVAQVVAQAMKDWAMQKGATHFTHWFQPMTGLTAEKHDAFIGWDDGGGVIESFSGSQLIQGEPDASSFPSGGLRATFEARGYTVWDPASPAFLIEEPLGKTLCIPTAFIGYHGEALDHKVPLLRSMEFVGKQATQALTYFGIESGGTVVANCGPEQEYFLLDAKFVQRRPDLIFAGRSLQGTRPPKGQEMEDHYFGSIKSRVLRYMQELELELYKLGIPAKTRHNEVAPNQFELAPIYEPANVAADHNQLMMEVMKKVADRHGLAVLLHEKPFQGINGSGKHNNWSLGTEDGLNMLDPGHTPEQNLLFLYTLAAVLKGIHRHGGLLRASIASAGNDHRLGANEAPPAIMSVFLGDQLTRIVDQIDRGDPTDVSERKILDLGIAKLPVLNKDQTDRNRTSPFAFTGNKFEFRAVGASQAIAWPLTVLNTVVGEALQSMNAMVEAQRKGSGTKDLKTILFGVIRATLGETKAVRFDGNNYSKEWREEAERRGLPMARGTVESLRFWEQAPARELFLRSGVLSKEELDARIHVRHEQYVKTVNIEAQVLREMAETQVLPAVTEDLRHKAESMARLSDVGVSVPDPVRRALEGESKLLGEGYDRLAALKAAMAQAEAVEGMHAQTEAYGTKVVAAAAALREVLDGLEDCCDASRWPLPKYREMLAPLV